ncbi:MAG: MarR family transcriptional regulator [Burkholderiales bacterium]|nr:MarR family transcriptional regulator [Opitutaceae bacterium]
MPATAHTATPAETAALDAYIKLMRASESVTSRAHTLLAGELTLTQFGVLEALHHRGPLSAGELAEKILKSAGNLTLVLANLERDGLVSRLRDRDDARRWIISLTAAGRKRIATLFPQVAAALTAEFSTLTLAEQAMLAELCKKLGRGRPAA